MADGIQETHMFGALDWQFADSIVMNHLRNTAERLTELTEDVSDRPTLRCLGRDLHVHEPTTTSAVNKCINQCRFDRHFVNI